MERDLEGRYLKLFEDSPVSLWEEDFSEVRRYLDDMKTKGITDLQSYFYEHPDEIWKCSEFVRIIRVNKATLDLQGVDCEDELVGSLGKILVEDALDLFLGEILALAEGKTKFEDTVTLRTVTGRSRHILLVLSVPEEFQETWAMVIVSMLDITDTVEAKNALESALEMAAFYNDLMAHDLSNIQQGIMSSMELLLESSEFPQSLRHLAEAALSQSKRGAALVRYVKKLAALEGDTHATFSVDPFSSMSVAIEMVKNTFPEKEIEISTNLTSNTYKVAADEFLVDVFYNLLHNSVRLDPESLVQINIHAKEEPDRFLRIWIIDRGPGIDDDGKQSILSGICDCGKRVKGIGLTLVRRIIGHYGGKMWIDDRVEGDHTQGVCFFFTIPLTTNEGQS